MPTHKKPESERFKGPVKWCHYIVVRGVVSFLQRLPIRFAFRLGRVAGWLCWKLLPSQRATVRKNLEIINAWLLEDRNRITDQTTLAMPIQQQVREVFIRNGANLLSSFTFSRMGGEQLEQHIEIDGIECLEDVLQGGKGAVIILSHMGPWEVLTKLPIILDRRGITVSFGALYRPLNNFYLDSWIKQDREAQGTRLFSRKDGFHAPAQFVRDGGILGVLADQRAGRGEFAPFFGKITLTTPLPGLLCKRANVSTITVSVETIGVARWRIRGFLLADPEHAQISDRRGMAIYCNQALERSLSMSICDGFWLHDRFRDDDNLYRERFAEKDKHPL